MKCPVCDNFNTSMVCPKCGFDSSRDYGKYPTFGPVGRVTSASALRKQYEKSQEPPKPVEPIPVQPEPPAEPRKKNKLLPLLIAAACAVVLGLGVWIGVGFGGGSSAEPGESVHMQEPPETTGESDRYVHVIGAEPWRGNVLRSDVPPRNEEGYLSFESAFASSVFGSAYRRDQIASIHFLDTLEDLPADAWDISEAGNGSVMAWVKPIGGLYDLYIGANGGINAPEDCMGLFMGYLSAQTIDFGEAFHTVKVKDMNMMFAHCYSLRALDLSVFDTANVQDMGGMFEACLSLAELDLSSFDTANVYDMSGMFSNCKVLKELDLSNFDTSNVQDMWLMFAYCKSLTELDLSGFDTANVQDMKWMFYDCYKLESLDLSSFDMANVQDTTDMFTSCPASDDWQHLLH